MNTKDLAGDDGSDGEGVEHVDKRLPDLDVCPALAFVVETVYSGDVGTLVVASQEEKVFRILDLVAK